MNRFEYLDALKDALFGLPEATVTSIVADYERRFAERSTAGQSEEEIMASLGDPQKVAAEKRAALQFNTFKEKKSFANLVRLFFSLIGLAVFNLFMLVPGIMYMSLLFVAYVVSLVFYGSGILVTAASLAGVSGMALHDPFDRVVLEHHVAAANAAPPASPSVNPIASASAAAGASTKMPTTAKNAVQASDKGPASAMVAKGAATTRVVADQQADIDWNNSADRDGNIRIDDSGVRIGGNRIDETGVHIGNNHIDESGVHIGNSHIDESGVHGSVRIDDSGIRISDADDEDEPRVVIFGTDFLTESRPAQVAIGIVMVLAGIVMFLLCLVVSKLTWAGVCRLAQMEFNVLKNA